MRIQKTLTTLVLALTFSLPLLANADSAPGNVLSDTAITAAIKTKLMAEPNISSPSVAIETNNGVVTVNGTVPTGEQAGRIVEIAESVDGVKKINTSQLKVSDSNQPLTDTYITAKVKEVFVREKLFGDNPIAAVTISVETKNSVVYLTGYATNKAQAKTAIRLAKSVDGVRKVKSNIAIHS